MFFTKRKVNGHKPKLVDCLLVDSTGRETVESCFAHLNGTKLIVLITQYHSYNPWAESMTGYVLDVFRNTFGDIDQFSSVVSYLSQSVYVAATLLMQRSNILGSNQDKFSIGGFVADIEQSVYYGMVVGDFALFELSNNNKLTPVILPNNGRLSGQLSDIDLETKNARDLNSVAMLVLVNGELLKTLPAEQLQKIILKNRRSDLLSGKVIDSFRTINPSAPGAFAYFRNLRP